uniref:NACHT and WD repeat domain-containing protein 1-like n=1 Tax=Saccoglossus kowalevskii TaxID=10224 RepID=A0ABM0MCU6_SACKO|nr:PREDICTED: NACHT and WD repeat domain-containing protein 1-like [Saccoglossus kowalevskii]
MEDVYKRLLRGSIDNVPQQESNIVRIFISSTFTDMVEERNTLMRDSFPDLRLYCQQHGLEFEVVDMRWGIRDEASSDHMTTELCIREIHNCHRLSSGPYFVAFIGNKYGYRPLPPRIKADKFEKMREISRSRVSLQDIQIIDDWYLKDTNAVPAEYVLQPITTRLVHFNDNDERASDLRKEDRDKWWKITQSLLTDKEVHQAIVANPDSVQRCLCFLREFDESHDNITKYEKANDYLDMTDDRLIDKEAQDMLNTLKRDKISTKMSDGILKKWRIPWSAKGVDPSNPQHKEYLQTLSEEFTTALKKLIDQKIAKDTNKVKNALNKEVLHHAKFCQEKCSAFRGRRDMLTSIRNYIIENKQGKPLCIHGVSGSGKTSVMAMAVKNALKWSGESSICVFRFLGTSPQSSTIHQTLQSVCSQICINYEKPSPAPHILEDYTDLVQYFKRALTTFPTKQSPLILILDSIDQLSATNDAHALNWLPKSLPDHVRIVVSMLPEEHGCLKTLKRSVSESNCYLEMEPLTGEMGREILDAWLESRQRTITETQREAILTALMGCPQPLFLKIVFDNLVHWKSYTPPENITVARDVREAIEFLFEALEKKHGKVFVSHALGYISAASDGLTEAELEDVLSLDDEVLDDVYQYWDPPTETIVRVPPLLWKRARYDIDEYLVERQAGGKTVLAWYHRQFIEATQKRYLNKNTKATRHYLLAEYFLGSFAGEIHKPITLTKRNKTLKLVNRQVASQPLEYGRDVYNHRKLSELPFHLLHSGQIDRLKQAVLCNFQWILSKLQATSFLEMIGDYDEALLIVQDKSIQLVRDGLMLASSNLKIDPLSTAGQIIGRLEGIPGADDKHLVNLVQQAFKWCEDAKIPLLIPNSSCLIPPGGPLKMTLAGHPKKVTSVAITSDDHLAVSACEVSGTECLVNIWNVDNGELIHSLKSPTGGEPHVVFTSDHNQVIFGTKSLSVYSLESGECIKTIGSSDEDTIVSMVASGDGRYLCIVNKKGELKIWEINSSKCIITVDTKHEGAIICFCLSVDDKFALTGGKDSILKVWDTGNGNCLANLTGHTAAVTCLVIHPDGKQIISGSDDSNLKIWNVNKEPGENLVATIKAHSKPITLIKLSASGEILISGSKDETLKSWSIVNQTCLQVFNGHQSSISCLCISAGDKYMVSGSKDDLLKIWELESGKCLNTLEGHSSWISCVALAHNGTAIISGSNDKMVKIWKFTDDAHVLHRERHETQPQAVAITSDGSLAASAAPGDNSRIWNHKTGECLYRLPGDAGFMVMTPDNQYVVTDSNAKDVKVWEVKDGKEIYTLKGHTQGIVCLTVTNDSRYAISACKDGSIRKWNLQTGESYPEWTGHNKPVKCLKVSTNNSRLASGSDDGDVRLWNITTGDCLLVLNENKSVVECIAITPKYLLVGYRAQQIRIWSIETGKMTDIVEDFGDSVKCLAITSDGSLMVAGSHESSRQLKLWSLDKGRSKHIFDYIGHHHAVMTIQITDNNQFVISGSRDCTIKVWNLLSGELLTSFDFQSQVKHLSVSKTRDDKPGSYKVVAANKSGMIGLFDLVRLRDNNCHGLKRQHKTAQGSVVCNAL